LVDVRSEISNSIATRPRPLLGDFSPREAANDVDFGAENFFGNADPVRDMAALVG
jgi:hypothetical protein